MTAVAPIIWCFDCTNASGDPDHNENHTYLTHGERDPEQADPFGPDGDPRCLCGADWYLTCMDWLCGGPGTLAALEIARD